jgi:hypothetical protein
MPPILPALERAKTGPHFPDVLAPAQEGMLRQAKDMGGRLRPFRYEVVQGWKAGKKHVIATLEKRR